MAGAGSDTYRRIYAVVRRIPRGHVATYGQVAELAGYPGQARLAGYALHALRDERAVPWHRVVDARGRLSLLRSGSGAGVTQRLRLEQEGVRFSAGGRVELVVFGWRPRGRPASSGARARPRKRPRE